MLMVLGASHHDLGLTQLDRLTGDPDLLSQSLGALVAREDSPLMGVVVVATCNRLEIYLDAVRFHDAIDEVTAAVAAATALTPDEVSASLKVRVGAPVAAHLFTVAAELRTRGCGELSVFSPSGRAASFADRHQAIALEAAGLAAAISAADLVVTCSGTSTQVIDEELLTTAVARRDKPLPIIDLALHADVSSSARSVPGVRVIDLHTVAEQADPAHLSAVTAAQDLVIAGVAAFEERLAIRRMDPAVVALRQHISGAVEKEMVRLRAKYPQDVAADVELALHRVTQSLLHTPTLRAKELARTGDGAGYVQALHTVFGIDITETAAAAHADEVRLSS